MPRTAGRSDSREGSWPAPRSAHLSSMTGTSTGEVQQSRNRAARELDPTVAAVDPRTRWETASALPVQHLAPLVGQPDVGILSLLCIALADRPGGLVADHALATVDGLQDAALLGV